MDSISLFERRKWLRSDTEVSDDPRRVPAPVGKADTSTIVLRGGRVFTATGTPAFDASLVVQGDSIKAILPADTNEFPAQSKIVDVTGMTVMPGLIDNHIHMSGAEPGHSVERAVSMADAALRSAERLRYSIESGITSVRDAGSHNDVPFVIKSWVRENRLPLPRVFAAGWLITGTGGHAAERLSPVSGSVGMVREASGPDDWRNAVRQMFKAGADVIKAASHYSLDEIRAMVDEAHTLGLKVMCDAETHYIRWAIEAGVDSIEHPLPRTDECIRLMAERGIASIPTLIPYRIIFDLAGGYFNSTSRRFSFSKEENMEVVRRMIKAGVKIGVGTDLVQDWFRYLPGAYIAELEALTEAGLSTTEALEAATRVNAEILDMDHLLGTLEVGKRADILVVRGKPDEALWDLQNVEFVLRDGHIVVKDGRIYQEKHTPRPLPESTGESKQWY